MYYIKEFLFIFALITPTIAFSYSAKYYYNVYEYKQLKDIEFVFVGGVNDALVIEYEWLRTCTESKSLYQLTGVFNKYLDNHPEQWKKPASVLYVDAMKKFCNKI